MITIKQYVSYAADLLAVVLINKLLTGVSGKEIFFGMKKEQ